jgi:hypothetical protein
MSMSLDGYIADADDGVKEVFAWLGSGAPDNAAIIEESMATSARSSPVAARATSRRRGEGSTLRASRPTS